MNIVFFTVSLRDGGAERVMANLANEFVKKDEVSILTVQKSADHYELNRNVKRLFLDNSVFNIEQRIRNKIRKISIFRIVRLIKTIKNQKPDVVVTFLPLPSIYIMITKLLSRTVRKTPVILSERADPNVEYHNVIVKKLIRLLYKKADGFVFQTEEAKNYYESFIKCDTVIIGNPISDYFLKYKKAKNRKKTIVSCGRLVEQKNFKLLIEAFSEFSINNPEYSLEIYGEGKQENELSELIEDLDMMDKIKLKGRVDDIASRIFDAGMFVLTSNCEGMPNALMEAMALGVPCISTDCPVGGPRLLIQNGKNGILIELNNKKQLIDAMVAIASNQKYALKISECSRECLKGYTVNRIVAKWREFIKGCQV